MKTTSNTSATELGSVKFSLAYAPVPAARPRIRVMRLKSGKSMGVAYYTGTYKNYVTDVPKLIPDSPIYYDKPVALRVTVWFLIKRPMKPANLYPKADVDNYAKSILDAITKNGTYWHDDVQVTELILRKQYTRGTPRTVVLIQPEKGTLK